MNVKKKKKANYPSYLAQNKALKYLHGINEIGNLGFLLLLLSLSNLIGSTTLSDNTGITNSGPIIQSEI